MLPIGKETPGVPHVPPAEWFIAKPLNQNDLLGDFSPEFEKQFGSEVRDLLWRVNHFLSDYSIKEVYEGKMITYSYEELLLKYPGLQAVDAWVHLWIGFTPETLLEQAHKLDYYAPSSHSKQSDLS